MRERYAVAVHAEVHSRNFDRTVHTRILIEQGGVFRTPIGRCVRRSQGYVGVEHAFEQIDAFRSEPWSGTMSQSDQSTNIKQESDPGSNAAKNPDAWVTGDEPATGAQRSYLQTLAEEASEPVPDDLSKADASKKIDELQERTGRGR
jgi:hypothetical protein